MFLLENNGRARLHAIEYDALLAREPDLKRRHVSIGACPPRMVRARYLGVNAPGSRNSTVARPAGTERPNVEY